MLRSQRRSPPLDCVRSMAIEVHRSKSGRSLIGTMCRQEIRGTRHCPVRRSSRTTPAAAIINATPRLLSAHGLGRCQARALTHHTSTPGARDRVVRIAAGPPTPPRRVSDVNPSSPHSLTPITQCPNPAGSTLPGAISAWPRSPAPETTPASCATTPTSATPQVDNDEIAWCAAFLGSCLERAGIASTRSLLARSYLAWGEPLGDPHYGAIAVLSRTSDPASVTSASWSARPGRHHPARRQSERRRQRRGLPALTPARPALALTTPVIPEGALSADPGPSPNGRPVQSRPRPRLEMEGG